MGRGARVKKLFDRILTKRVGFSRDATLVSVSETVDSLGDVTATTETQSTIEIDFQPITKEDHNLIEQGLASPGDARGFASSDITINPDDYLIVDSIRWQFKSKIEPDDVEGVIVAQSWILTRADG